MTLIKRFIKHARWFLIIPFTVYSFDLLLSEKPFSRIGYGISLLLNLGLAVFYYFKKAT
jgi:hypothetical protein